MRESRVGALPEVVLMQAEHWSRAVLRKGTKGRGVAHVDTFIEAGPRWFGSRH